MIIISIIIISEWYLRFISFLCSANLLFNRRCIPSIANVNISGTVTTIAGLSVHSIALQDREIAMH